MRGFWVNMVSSGVVTDSGIKDLKGEMRPCWTLRVTFVPWVFAVPKEGTSFLHVPASVSCTSSVPPGGGVRNQAAQSPALAKSTVL